MIHPEDVNIDDYSYNLTDDKIAYYPPAVRGQSKLLIYHNDTITDTAFNEIHSHFRPNTLVVFNQTKVVHARLLFEKENSSMIEIFCLEPLLPETELTKAFIQPTGVTWRCLVGKARKWKSGKLTMTNGLTTLTAEKTGFRDDSFEILFNWNNPDMTFAEILQQFGHIPLPPYIKRPDKKTDNDRYQTIYAHVEGSVAAPTAGLHFTKALLDKTDSIEGCKTDYVTLHVGAGTFKPVTTSVHTHLMHTEKIYISINNITNLIDYLSKGSILAVGTTSLRTLESLYWIGVNILIKAPEPLYVSQFLPYVKEVSISPQEALTAIMQQLQNNHKEYLEASTSLFIMPGYSFRIVSQLVTNFHQPRSTLLLLIAAFTGNRWKEIYRHALENNYRFLSYGDACFFSTVTLL